MTEANRSKLKTLFSLATTAFIFALFALPGVGIAQIDLSQWLNPGPLAKPHERLEGVRQCAKCHATAKGVPDRKCLDCHSEIAEKLHEKKGFHARQSADCYTCHSDHKGRDYDLTGLKRIKFDHNETGWPLTGRHRSITCDDCHKQSRADVETKQPTGRRTYLGAATECSACHKDPHKGGKPTLEDCVRCHTTGLWVEKLPKPSFNHDQEARYPLTGAHVRVKCYGCHKQKVWQPLSFDTCTTCHVDPHKGSFGPKCEKCHTTRSWRGATPGGKQGKAFDHDKTAFPLSGAHKEVTCLKCHGPVIGKMKDFDQCTGCHKNPHGEQFQTLWTAKKTCTDCHRTESWKILLFQHNRDSRYELQKKHLTVPCQKCHTEGKWRWFAKTPDCVNCHKDVHRSQFEKPCASCHSEAGFSSLTFNHDRDSPFPMVGKHKVVTCGKCHMEGRYKPLERKCQGCHTDFHKGELGQECMRCHAPTGFNDVEFDHNSAKFRLNGKHTSVACNQCHKDYKYKLPGFDCASCHVDVHKGSFGTACNRCHTTEGFAAKSGFHDFGEFSLGGAHDTLECLTCHGPAAPVRAKPAQCSTCHVDPHLNSLGTSCSNCHTQRTWLPTTFRHQQTGFELSGAHRFLSCDRCHVNRVFGGLPSECQFCHAKDFQPPTVIPQHAGAPDTCDTCHFTFGWRPTR